MTGTINTATYAVDSDNNRYVKFTLLTTNQGATAAVDLTVVAGCRAKYRDDRNDLFDELLNKVVLAKVFLGPKDQMQTQFDCSEQDWEDIVSNKKIGHLLSLIRYKDRITDRKYVTQLDYIVKASQALSLKNRQLIYNNADGNYQLESHDSHNCMDEACPKQKIKTRESASGSHK